MGITYKDAGVDWQKGDEFVARIKKMVESTHGPAVKQGIGGFASLYELADGRLLAAGTDGVGTKLKIAHHLNIHDTVGIDLVAMCANDVICIGARPLFFLDYIGCGKLELSTSEAIVKGIVDGCRETGMALVGGETAEMPGMYDDGEYDLAGFCVGEVKKEDLLDGSKVKPGDAIVALPSSGLHSNGFSLVRKLVKPDEKELLQTCMAPTRLYVKPILNLFDKGLAVHGVANITGSGFHNIRRMNPKFGYEITQMPEPSPLFVELHKRAGSTWKDMHEAFNVDLGMVVVTSDPDSVIQNIDGAYVAGKVTDASGEVKVERAGESFTLQP